MPIAFLTPSFMRVTNRLQEESGFIADTLAGSPEIRPWQVPDNGNGFLGNPEDFISVEGAFDREANHAIARVTNQVVNGVTQGRVGDNLCNQMQGDYLSTAERAFRSRHTTTVRAQMHAAARRVGHTSQWGPFRRRQQYAVNLLILGYNGGF